MIGIGVVGYGYWGTNLVRNFSEVEDARVVAVSDVNQERLALAKTRYPGIVAMSDCAKLINHKDVDAVVIATPVSSHFDIAAATLGSGKHVLVEKPLTQTTDQAMRLIEEAERRDLRLMVDHTFIYTGAVQKMRELTGSGELGVIRYYDSTRINLGLFQHDVSVVWDLAVHDLAIMDYTLSARPIAVSATGCKHVPERPESVAFLTMFFEQELIAHINVSWLAPVKIRQTLVGGSEKMIVYDDLEPSEKIKVYDKGITVVDDPENVHEIMVNYRMGDMWAPQVSPAEALLTEAKHFVDCIERRTKPRTDGLAGLRVVRVLEAASRSLELRGAPQEIRSDDWN